MRRTRRLAVILFAIAALLAPAGSATALAQADEITCDDFTNQDAAQIVLELDDRFEDALDEDSNGEACPDLPARDVNGSSGEEVVLGIGFTRALFEDEHGEPADDRGADDFDTGEEYTGVGEYDAINIFWVDDFAAHIVVPLKDELTEPDAFNEAMNFLPSTAEVEESAEVLDDNELLYAGRAEDIETIFDEEVYKEFGVGGEPGDVRIILIPGEQNVAMLDIAIGLGEEFGGGTGTTGDPDPTEETGDPSGEAAEYLDAVRKSTDQLLDEAGTFNDLFLGGTQLSDADIDILVEILMHWSTVSMEAEALTAPDGYEEIQSTFEDATVELEQVSAIFAEGEDADFEAAIGHFEEAEALLDDLDELLTEESV
jgi:exonuclease VII small subunit